MNPNIHPNANSPEPLNLRRFAVLDGIGNLFMGLGLAKVFGNVDLIPVALRFEHYGIALIALGACLCIPTVISLLARIRCRRESSHL